MLNEKIDVKKVALGIELGSTRIKGVLIDESSKTIASGEFHWENHYIDQIWTYHLDEVWHGIQRVFQEIAREVLENHSVQLTSIGSIGISGMMHGYLPFNKEAKILVPFRTWRNMNTKVAAERLTELFQFNIPQRWSIAHLYQAILDGEEHVKEVDFFTTLAGYVHWKLTDERVLGVGEASGMFPIDMYSCDYKEVAVEKFNGLLKESACGFTLRDVIPTIKKAGEVAGVLTTAGARLLDPTGNLQAGIPFCPPEGDAGTGMVATNSIRKHTGNVSAGTSIFSMIVLDKELSNYYTEIDVVNTPTGNPVAMVHCNNFTSDLNAWVRLFGELLQTFDRGINSEELYSTLFKEALLGDSDSGGLMNCNYYSGETITNIEEGRPLFIRMPESNFNLRNFMRSQITSSLATLKVGMDMLTHNEKVYVNNILGHGGFFKTEKVGQQFMADALNVPVSVMSTAGDGGPWGMALLASFAVNKKGKENLTDYLEAHVFQSTKINTVNPTESGRESFHNYMERYVALLEVERAAIEHLR